MFKPGQLPSQIPPSHPAAMNIIQAANRMGIVGMTPNYLPKPDMPLHLQFLFQPRPLSVYVKPMKKNKCRPLDQFSSHGNLQYYMDKFEEVFDQSEEEEGEKEPQKVIPTAQGVGLPQKKKVVYREQKIQKHRELVKEELKKWDPQENEKATGDPYKTLFVARIVMLLRNSNIVLKAYETSEKKLRKEFEIYGPIKQIKLIRDSKSEKPRGYCFIEYEHKRDFITAYKQADGKKIDGRRVLVDCERARVVKSWKPRRFGGGKGETRKGKDDYIYERLSRSRSRSHSHHRKKKHRSRSKDKKREKDRERERDREKERDSRKHREKEKDRKKDRKDREPERKTKDERKAKDERTTQPETKMEVENSAEGEKNPTEGEKMQKQENQQPITEMKPEEPTTERRKAEEEEDPRKEHKKKKKHKDKDKNKEKRKSKKHYQDESAEEPDNKEKHKKHKHKRKKERTEKGKAEIEQSKNLEEEENKEREEGEQDAAELQAAKHKSKHRHRSKKHRQSEENEEERKERKKHKHQSKKKKEKRRHQENQQSEELNAQEEG